MRRMSGSFEGCREASIKESYAKKILQISILVTVRSSCSDCCSTSFPENRFRLSSESGTRTSIYKLQCYFRIIRDLSRFHSLSVNVFLSPSDQFSLRYQAEIVSSNASSEHAYRKHRNYLFLPQFEINLRGDGISPIFWTR
jgi:hypothetical protein